MNTFMRNAVAAAMVCGLVGWSVSAYAQIRSNTRQSGTSSTEHQGAGLKGDALVQYDAETGSLIIVTDDETNEEIGKVIEDLDRPIPQVLIKVLFLEVTHSDDLDLGIEGFLQKKETYNFSDRVDTETIETLFGLGSETTGGFYRIIENDLDITLRALSEVAKLEVLSRPSILTRNNQEAVITIGQEVPFIRNSRITDNGQTINTVEYEDIGIILTVTPHITENRVVSMDVTPEISTLTGQTVPISDTVNAPVFAKRSAETGVIVPDGSTVVIGGLMEDNTTKNTRKVPVLGDIPLLGAAFRRKVDSKTKTELLIFLTPHVIDGFSEMDELTLREKANSELAPKAFKSDVMERYLGDAGKLGAEAVSPLQPSEEAATVEEEPVVPEKAANKGVFKSRRSK